MEEHFESTKQPTVTSSTTSTTSTTMTTLKMHRRRPASVAQIFCAISFFVAACDAFCPHLCQCDDALMVVTCPSASQLDVIPITLNPMIRTLVLQGNRLDYFWSAWSRFFKPKSSGIAKKGHVSSGAQVSRSILFWLSRRLIFITCLSSARTFWFKEQNDLGIWLLDGHVYQRVKAIA